MNEAVSETGGVGSVAAAVQRVLLTRVTCHDFASRALPEGALGRALLAAMAAPNHRLTEPWRFIRVGAATREVLASVQARLKDKGRTPSEATLARAREKLLTPAELIVVCSSKSQNAAVEREDYAATACAIQNLCVSLWSEGVASKWSTGGVTTDAETYAVLGVNPAEQSIIGFLSLGYAAGDVEPTKPARKLGLADVLRTLP